MANRIRLEGDDVLMELRSGVETRFDIADLSLVTAYTWSAVPAPRGGFYARSFHAGYMHRLILGLTDERKQADHINHDTLDNRRCNLRVVANRENNQNRNGAYRNSSTGVRGLTVNRSGPRTYYKASVMVNYKVVATRTFPYSEEGKAEAAAWLTETRKQHMPFDTGIADTPKQDGAPDTTGRAYQRHRDRFTPDQVREIRRRAAAGERQSVLAQEFQRSRSDISRIVNRIDWKDLPQ